MVFKVVSLQLAGVTHRLAVITLQRTPMLSKVR